MGGLQRWLADCPTGRHIHPVSLLPVFTRNTVYHTAGRERASKQGWVWAKPVQGNGGRERQRIMILG